MKRSPRRSVLNALLAALLPLLFILTGAGLSPADQGGAAMGASPAAAPGAVAPDDYVPLEMADVFTLDYDGNWFCPQDPDRLSVQVCPEETEEGHSSGEFVEYLIEDVVAHPELDPPEYMRVGKARRFCSLADVPDGLCATAVPEPSAQPCLDTTLPPAEYEVRSPYCALQGLKDVGIKLGVIVGAAAKLPDGTNVARSVEELTYHACQISKADRHTRFYDFMFLDLSFKLKNDELKEAVQKIQEGISWNPELGRFEPCEYGAWPRLITNDTTYPHRTLETGAWGHAKKFEVLGRTGDPLRPAFNAALGLEPAITTKDLEFIRDVHQNDPGSHPILRFEVTSQTNRFVQLGGPVIQCKLLRQWAEQQELGDETEQYSMIYPLYVHGVPAKPRTYDSVYRGTFDQQRELIHYDGAELESEVIEGCNVPSRRD